MSFFITFYTRLLQKILKQVFLYKIDYCVLIIVCMLYILPCIGILYINN